MVGFEKLRDKGLPSRFGMSGVKHQHLLKHILAIRDFLRQNESMVRTIDVEKRSTLGTMVQEALSKILKAVSTSVLGEACADKTIQETNEMLPSCAAISASFEQAVMLEWIHSLVAALAVAPAALQGPLLQLLRTLFSFLHGKSVAALRREFGSNGLCRALVVVGNSLLAFAGPVQVPAFGGFSCATWNASELLQASLLRLAGQLVEAAAPFLCDLLMDVWWTACLALNTNGSAELVHASLTCLVQMGTRSSFPQAAEDAFLRGLCHILAQTTARSEEIDNALARCVDLLVPQLSVLALHTCSDRLLSLAAAAVGTTSSRALQESLLKVVASVGDRCRLGQTWLQHLTPLIGKLDHHRGLADCFVTSFAVSRAILKDAVVAIVLPSPNIDAAGLLTHTRVICLAARVFLDRRNGSDVAAEWESVESKFMSLLQVLKMRAKPREAVVWARHVAIIFRFACHCAERLPLFFSPEWNETLIQLVLAGWLESSITVGDEVGFEARLACVQAVAGVENVSRARARDVIMAGVMQNASTLLMDASLKALSGWLAVIKDAQMSGQIAADLISLAKDRTNPAAIRVAGLSVCCAIDCPRSDLCNSTIGAQLKWENWFALFELLKGEPPVAVAALEALSRVLSHIGKPDSNSKFVKLTKESVFPLFAHDSASVRLAFADLVPSLCAAMPELVPALAKDVASKFPAAAPPKQASILSFLSKVATFDGWHDSSLFVLALYAMIRSFHHKDLMVRAAAYEGVRDVARARGMSEQQLFWKFEEEIFSVFLIKELCQDSALLDEVALFLEMSHPDLLRRTMSIWMPKVVSEPAESVLEVVASLLRVSVEELLTENSVAICLHILLEEPGYVTASEFIAKKMDPLDQQMDMWMHDLLREVVVAMGNSSDQSYRERCVRGISRLALAHVRVTRKDKDRMRPLSAVELADVISSCFLAIMDKLDDTLLPSNDNLGQRKSFILGFGQLLELIANGRSAHLVSLRPKIIATLKLALKLPDLQADACNVFLKFLQLLGVENIGPVLGQIVVDLLPYVAHDAAPATSKKVVEILEWLIVNHAKQLSKHFVDVHFLPDLPALSHVQEVLERYGGAMGAGGLDGTLAQLTVGLQHESINVRLMAVMKLMSVLRSHRGDIDSRILQRQRVAPVIEKILPHLLSGSKGMTSPEAKGQYAACLGLLGAIDPGRVDLLLRLEFQSQCEDAELAIELLNQHLVPALEEARNTETQVATAFGIAAYAIQEVLKFCGCDADTPAMAAMPESELRTQRERKRRNAVTLVWNKLDPKTQSIVRPYLASCYLLNDEGTSAPKSGTFYNSYNSFRRWVGHFASHLISCVQGSSKALFAACRSSVKDHDHIARYLLPYLILRLAKGKEERELIRLELCGVLLAEVPKSADMSQLCTQTVFHTIDVLVHWVEEKRKMGGGPVASAMSASKPGAGRKRAKTSSVIVVDAEDELPSELPADYGGVCLLLSAIPQIMIAKAALRCGAYARALKSLESHVRDAQIAAKTDAQKKDILIQILPVLQQIFGGLEDSDGLEGLSKLRRCTNPEEQILEQEHRGNWSFALDWYEGAIRLSPHNAELRIGQLRCLLNLGHFETMLSLVHSARLMPLVRGAGSSMDEEGGSSTTGGLSLIAGNLAANRRESYLMAAAAASQQGSDALIPRGHDPSVAAQLLSSGMQAAWRLMHWPEVERFMISSLELPKEDFEVNIARCLASLVSRNSADFKRLLQQTRVDVMGPLLAASMDSYQRSFPYLVQLHMLSELEEMGSCVLANKPVAVVFKQQWNARLKMTSASFKVRQGILHLRRVVSQMQAANAPLASKLWVEVARAARGDGQLEASRSALVQALAADPNDVSALIERAKLLYIQGKRQMAILEVEQVIKAAPLSVDMSFEASKQRAKPELLLGQWLHETGQKPFEGIREQFERVIRLCPEWESGHFFVASYLDQVMKSYEQEASNDKKVSPKESLKLLPDIVKGYRMALETGYKHIHQSLPRMLTLYFTYGRELFAKKGDTVLSNIEAQLHEEMKMAISRIPMYVWLGAMPQLISRVCHDNPTVKEILGNLIQMVFRVFSKQVMWMAVGVLRASHRAAARKEIKEILEKVTSKDAAVKQVYQQTLELADLVSALCRYPGPDKNAVISKLKLSAVPDLMKLRKFKDARVIVPSESALVGTLPLSGRPTPDWNAFGEVQPTTIYEILDDVEVLRSLQSPKVFVVMGSNGLPYRFLAKPEDDLRKDSRVMEVNSLVNKLLARDIDSRRRQLRIHTFAVIPLDEKNGLIEWVPNLVAYRMAVMQFYGNNHKHTKNQYESLKQSTAAARYNQVMAEFPLRFHQWFAVQFPEPMSWLDARLCYTRSAAVMSIVGTVIGLGDRHGENILLDKKTGHVVHVDFNAIFNKGETFQVPERVPFRLTRNMVDAMGLTGYEGGFRRVCEITMQVLRQNRDMVLSVLETFLYDPLVEFTLIKDPSAAKKGAKKDATRPAAPEAAQAEPVNEKALEIISIIDKRLNGRVDANATSTAAARNVSKAVALSVEGHIEHLIQQATNPANLGAMFVGWAPWV